MEKEKHIQPEEAELDSQSKEEKSGTKRKTILSIFSSLFTIVSVVAFSSYLTNLDSPNSYFSK